MYQQIGNLTLIIVIVFAQFTQETQHQLPGGLMESSKAVKAEEHNFGDAEIEDLMNLDLGIGSPASPSSLLAIITSLEHYDTPEAKIQSQLSSTITNKCLRTENTKLVDIAENEGKEEENTAQDEDDGTTDRYPSPLLAPPLEIEPVPQQFYSNQIYNLFHQHGPLYQGNLVLHPPPPERLPPFQTLMTKVKDSFFPIVVERKEGNFTHTYRTYGILKPTKQNPSANTDVSNPHNRSYRTQQCSTTYRRNLYAPTVVLNTGMLPRQSQTGFHEGNQMSHVFPGFRASNKAYGYTGCPTQAVGNTSVIRGHQRYHDNQSPFYQQAGVHANLGVHAQAPYARDSHAPYEIAGQVPYKRNFPTPYPGSDGLLIGSPVGFSGGSLLAYTRQPGLGPRNSMGPSYRWVGGQPLSYVRSSPSYLTLNPAPMMLPFHPQQGHPAWGSITSTQSNAAAYSSTSGVSAHTQKYLVQERQPWPHPAARQAATPWNTYHHLQNPKILPSAYYARANPTSESTNSGSETGKIGWPAGEHTRQSGQSATTSQQNFGGSIRDDLADLGRVNPFAHFLARRRPNDVYNPSNRDPVEYGSGTTTNDFPIDGSNSGVNSKQTTHFS